MAQVSYKLDKFPKDVVLTVIVIETPRFKVRKWVGFQLIRLAVWVWGCGVEFVE